MTPENPYRYELKYIVNPEEFFLLESLIYGHRAGFRKAHPDRFINNIYFDSILMDAGQDNLSGISNRTKLRYRWYNQNNFGEFEFKIKKNALGSKKYIPLENVSHLSHLMREVNQKVDLHKQLFPVLQNRYKRRYFIDATQKFRLTIDSNIKYKVPQGELGQLNDPQFENKAAIVELKFDGDAKHADFITSQIPFRLSKHSKYVTGLFGLYS